MADFFAEFARMSSRQFKRAMEQQMALEVLELGDESSEEECAPVKSNAFAMFDSDTESEEESDEEDAQPCEKVAEPTTVPATPESTTKNESHNTTHVYNKETNRRKKKNSKQSRKRRGKKNKRGKSKNSGASGNDKDVEPLHPADTSVETSATVELGAASAAIATATGTTATSSTTASDTGASLAVNMRFLNDEYELKQVAKSGLIECCHWRKC